MNQGFIYAATTACLVLLVYFIQKAGSKPDCGIYKFSKVVIGIFWFGLFFIGGLVLTGFHIAYSDPTQSSDIMPYTWGLFAAFVFFIFAVTYYPSVRFTIENGTLTYKSIWATKIFDLTQPFTMTCYPASGQYVIRQGKMKTKISSYMSGWQYLLEEIENQATAMEKIEKK